MAVYSNTLPLLKLFNSNILKKEKITHEIKSYKSENLTIRN